jgi:hypothetical protein
MTTMDTIKAVKWGVPLLGARFGSGYPANRSRAWCRPLSSRRNFGSGCNPTALWFHGRVTNNVAPVCSNLHTLTPALGSSLAAWLANAVRAPFDPSPRILRSSMRPAPDIIAGPFERRMPQPPHRHWHLDRRLRREPRGAVPPAPWLLTANP